jgi:hypothetical protein
MEERAVFTRDTLTQTRKQVAAGGKKDDLISALKGWRRKDHLLGPRDLSKQKERAQLTLLC